MLAAGPLHRPQIPRAAGPRDVPGPRLPLGAVGPRLRPRGQARRVDRHRRQRHPVLPGDRAGRRAAARLPAHPGVGDPARHDAPTREAPSAATRGSTGGARLHRARLYWTNESRVWPIFHPAAGARVAARWRDCTSVAQVKDRDARRRADARLHDRLQAHPDLQRLVPDVQPPERRAGDRRHPRSARARHRHRRRRSSARSTASSSARVSWSTRASTCRTSRSRDCPATRCNRTGRRAPRPTTASPSPATRTCSSWSGPTRRSATTRSSS